MSSIIKIAVDAMGGDNSPKKIIDGVTHHFSFNQSTFYKIFGDKIKY
jgi:glycerol-3-phosphate acyltransferase PlsX